MNHTPTPWTLGYRTNFYKQDGSSEETEKLKAIGKDRFEAISISIHHTIGPQICLVPLDESSKENAEFILRAVNSHDELLEAAKIGLEVIQVLQNDGNYYNQNIIDDLAKIKKAIAKAEGK